MKSFSVLMIFVLSSLSHLSGANWPAWRGPTGNGVSSNGKFPSDFTNEKNVKWKVALPGSGSSTPAIWEDYILKNNVKRKSNRNATKINDFK